MLVKGATDGSQLLAPCTAFHPKAVSYTIPVSSPSHYHAILETYHNSRDKISNFVDTQDDYWFHMFLLIHATIRICEIISIVLD